MDRDVQLQISSTDCMETLMIAIYTLIIKLCWDIVMES